MQVTTRSLIASLAMFAFVIGAAIALLLAVFAIADASRRSDYQAWWGYAIALMIPGAVVWWWNRKR